MDQWGRPEGVILTPQPNSGNWHKTCPKFATKLSATTPPPNISVGSKCDIYMVIYYIYINKN